MNNTQVEFNRKEKLELQLRKQISDLQHELHYVTLDLKANKHDHAGVNDALEAEIKQLLNGHKQELTKHRRSL